ncbi:MAG: nitroreductase family protein [candidate division Zixibacteria bacterium]|nr:nitroreductase family protein [candidate division Zixibacteria bacterium]
MNVFEAIKKRRSIRGYLDKPIEEEKLKRVLEAGRLAPSAKNAQDWKYVVVKDPKLRKEVAKACHNQMFIAEAPVAIVGCAIMPDFKLSSGQLAGPIDVTISMDHMTIQAVEEGLGTCWIGAFDEEKVKKVLGIPDWVRIVEILPLGYPAVEGSFRGRKSFEEVFVWDKWK